MDLQQAVAIESPSRSESETSDESAYAPVSGVIA